MLFMSFMVKKNGNGVEPGERIGFYGLAAAAVSLIYGVFFNTPLGEWLAIAAFVLYVYCRL